jgi:hypothetical protein
MAELVTPRDSVIAELERVLASPVFEGAGRARALLRFVVEETLNDRADRLKEYTLGAETLGKGDALDPRTDPIVRAEVSRLRSRLERYYAIEGQADPVIIALPKGSYVLQFLERAQPSMQYPPAAEANSSPNPQVRSFCSNRGPLYKRLCRRVADSLAFKTADRTPCRTGRRRTYIAR